MTKTMSVSFEVDEAVKAEAEAIYANYGMSIADAFRIFLYKTQHIGGLPFELREQRIPNAETLAAMQEGDEIIKVGKARFSSASELLKELKA